MWRVSLYPALLLIIILSIVYANPLLCSLLVLYAAGIGAEKQKQKRGAYFGDRISPLKGWTGSHIPLQESELFPQGVSKFLPFPQYDSFELSSVEVGFNKGSSHSSLPPLPPLPALPPLHSNSIEKPVDEPQEYVPPQSIRSAVIPLLPPPATPVNAAASNVPANMGAVYLGSGSLGVVSLGNGAYALGSGSLGYSQNRAQPRPNGKVPVIPPLQAAPNLIPAAVQSQQPFQPSQPPFHNPSPPQPQPFFPGFDFTPTILKPQFNPTGYEPLTPDRITFGSPSQIPRRLKVTMSFATPTVQQTTFAVPNPPQNFGPNTPDINAPQLQPFRPPPPRPLQQQPAQPLPFYTQAAYQALESFIHK